MTGFSDLTVLLGCLAYVHLLQGNLHTLDNADGAALAVVELHIAFLKHAALESARNVSYGCIQETT